jgi:hypothetical protein
MECDRNVDNENELVESLDKLHIAPPFLSDEEMAAGVDDDEELIVPRTKRFVQAPTVARMIRILQELHQTRQT